MRNYVDVLAVIGMLVGFYGLLQCWKAARKTRLVSGRDYDERGRY